MYQHMASTSDSAVILSTRELSHIKNLAHGSGTKIKEKKRKDELRKISQDRYKNWTNTLEAQRVKKKNARAARLEAIENAQKLIDEEERQHSAMERRRAIERANQIMYKENERVKNFQGALLLSGIQKQRESQIRLKKKLADFEKVREQQWYEQTLQAMKKQDERVEREEQIRIEKAKQVRETQLEQLEIYRDKIQKEHAERIAEGERARELALQSVEEGKIAEKERQMRTRRANEEWVSNIEKLKTVRKEKKKLEKLEEDKLKKYAEEKERMLEIRRKKEAEKKAEKMYHQQKLIDDQYERLSKIINNEDGRVAKEVAIADAKREDVYRKKLQRQAEQKELIDRSRAQQMALRLKEKQRQAEEDRQLKEHWKMRTMEMEAQEAENERKTRENATRLANFLKEQARQKNLSKTKEREESLGEARRLAEMQKKEDEIFEQYTQAHIDLFAAQNLSTKPMTIALERDRIRQTRLKV